ncbi:hypothetical protein F542_2710 [Bibersteinia trehalosi USDA-ARS-USMARC-188]|uniref:Uncharacterized protein n=3 Tax=Bibersteinia trehalosi TaxID=47735 RepID=W0R9U9_BIBTR|nr:hypothetical protein WQG_19880 [Bibersteinia trehalosi USDA-ARS-USMARC-192]AHG80989.1 hypothetical protein F542_2710 [Bibersteinia trehalosi USDA-ARS-USMARC-188]AHG83201.1 hypothetical protein F543_3370 [Bibersteinia trehalosi USDA-ARS-USMARC-189]AHG87197.1 hypothetical protein F544_19690 [Bibersteinia trehalosi USDA-ARS-USMARC-190]
MERKLSHFFQQAVKIYKISANLACSQSSFCVELSPYFV